MTILQQRASDVRTQEINLSSVITSASSAIACQVVVSKQGSPDPLFFTTADDYIAEYGNPDASVSFDVYAALDFFKEGDQMWARRAVHADALYSSVLLYTNASGTTTTLLPITAGVKDPTNPDWGVLSPSPTDEAVALFYPRRGPGSYANKLAVSIVSSNIKPPATLTATTAVTGGIIVAGTYQYQVSALGANGETLATAPVSVVVSGVAVTNSITLTWANVPLAKGYRLYGRLSSSVGLVIEVGQGTLSFTDTGSIAIDTTIQPIVSPADLPAAEKSFTVNVFDLSVNTSVPAESFICTLSDAVDPSGVAMELEARINPFSQYIRVTSNAQALVTEPIINTAAIKVFDGGDSGTAPSSYDVANAYSVFKNKQLYAVNTFVNGGHADPIVQLAMDAIAQGRGDAIAVLDVPSISQDFQAAINYRNLTLNLNSTYSALFNPDQLEADNINGKSLYVPFSGWAAALCARTDRVANPSFSIAGLNRGLVGILKSRYTFDDAQATQLFKAQVNYTRTFTGQGTALWEQQTLSGDTSALSWMSVRRIVNVMKVSIYKFLLYSLQEPNDDFTGRQIVTSCTDYLEIIKNARGISSYTVVSDASNNSAAMFNSGIRRVTVIVVPIIPIHEIQLDMVISKQGVSFDEVLRQVTGG